MDGRRGFMRKMAGGAFLLTMAGHGNWILQDGPPKLQNGWEVYNAYGQVLFPIYGPSGGLAQVCILYLIRPWANGKGVDSIPLEFDGLSLHNADKEEMKKLIFDRIDAAIKADKFRKVEDGNDFGRDPGREHA